MLKEVCEVSSVCGNEYELSNKLYSILQPFNHELITQKSGNLIVHIKGNKSNRKIMVFTHIDEPGLVINNIDENGFLNFNIVGDIKISDLASQEVIVSGKREILGLIGLRPPHILKEEERKASVTMDELNIDISFRREESKELVSKGDTAVIKRNIKRLKDNIITGRAISDKAGIAILYNAIKEVKDTNDDIYFVFGVQHYNNYIGSVEAVNFIKPDIALVIDYTEAKSREKNSISVECGKGPVIYRGPTASSNLTEDISKYANHNIIKYQVNAGSGKNKTDAWAIQISCGGIPTIIMNNPVKYPNSFVETSNMDDIIEASKLLIGYICHLESIDWSDLLCF